MFLNNASDLTPLVKSSQTVRMHSVNGSNTSSAQMIPTSCDVLKYSAQPRRCGDKYAGVNLVAQYLEAFAYRINGIYQITQQNIEAVWRKAIELDEADADANKIDFSSDTYPSLKNTIKSFIQLGYAAHSDGVGMIANQRNDIKYFIRQYRGIMLETKITSTTYNAYEFIISPAGETISEDFTKGFIAYGYTDSDVYVQNTLGVHCGSLGFHRIPWNVMDQILIRGMVFNLQNPS